MTNESLDPCDSKLTSPDCRLEPIQSTGVGPVDGVVTPRLLLPL